MRKKSEPTIVEQAAETIEGFAWVWKLLDQQVTLRGQSHSTLGNCIRFISGDISGTKELRDSSQSLTIYPKPAATSATFRFTTEFSGTKTLSIFDLKGHEVVYKELGILPKGVNQIELNLSGLPNGQYTCQLSDGSIKETSKLIISR